MTKNEYWLVLKSGDERRLSFPRGWGSDKLNFDQIIPSSIRFWKVQCALKFYKNDDVTVHSRCKVFIYLMVVFKHVSTLSLATQLLTALLSNSNVHTKVYNITNSQHDNDTVLKYVDWQNKQTVSFHAVKYLIKVLVKFTCKIMV